MVIFNRKTPWLLGKPTILGNPHITSPTRGPFFHCSAMVCRNLTRTRLRNGDRLHLCQGFSQHHVTLGTRKPRGQLTVEIGGGPSPMTKVGYHPWKTYMQSKSWWFGVDGSAFPGYFQVPAVSFRGVYPPWNEQFAPENRPLEKEIPIGNHHFQVLR